LNSPLSVGLSKSNVGFKILAAVVFLLLIFVGTYFVSVANPPIPILGYIIGALAFIVAPKIWRGK
jgi:hypothetical protein